MDFFCSLGFLGMKFLSLGIPGVLRSNYFCDFVDVEGKKEVIIPRPNNIECHCMYIV